MRSFRVIEEILRNYKGSMEIIEDDLSRLWRNYRGSSENPCAGGIMEGVWRGTHSAQPRIHMFMCMCLCIYKHIYIYIYTHVYVRVLRHLFISYICVCI